MFWDTTHEDLNSKINTLESRILSSQAIFGFGGHDWNRTIELMKEIQEDFKKVRYPSKAERDQAWQTFFNLREDAYRIKREQYEENSQRRYDEISGYLSDAYHGEFMDSVVDVLTFNLMRTTVDDMKWKGQQLREAGRLFKQYKFEMTRDHKSEIHERMVSIRESHDAWWGQYRSYQEEKQKVWEEKQEAWRERQVKKQAARERIEQNLENNREKLHSAKEKLEKAEDALDRYKQRRDDLQDKINDSSNENWIEKAEQWLDEFEDKISDIERSIADKESYIERLESWIDEDESKLRSWD